MVCELLVAGVGRIAMGRALAKTVGIKGVIAITPISENQMILFVESTDLAIFFIWDEVYSTEWKDRS